MPDRQRQAWDNSWRTWRSEAERVGTWLNDAARARGWLGGNGKVLPQAQAVLLDLRRDADASINATAD